MIERKERFIDIDGIYGNVRCSAYDADNFKHSTVKIDTKTGLYITEPEEGEGLPNGMTRDDYFRIALLSVLNDISKSLEKDAYVNVKNLELDKVILKLCETLEKVNK